MKALIISMGYDTHIAVSGEHAAAIIEALSESKAVSVGEWPEEIRFIEARDIKFKLIDELTILPQEEKGED